MSSPTHPMTTVRPLPQDEATPRQKDAIIGLCYHRSPFITKSSSMDELLDAVESLTGIAVDSWDTLDKKTASQVISKLTA